MAHGIRARKIKRSNAREQPRPGEAHGESAMSNSGRKDIGCNRLPQAEPLKSFYSPAIWMPAGPRTRSFDCTVANVRIRLRNQTIAVGAAAVAILTGTALSLPITLTPGLRARLTTALAERFNSQVEVTALRVSVLPSLRISGNGVVLRHRGRTDVPPLIVVESFSADATIWGLTGKPVHFRRVRLEGLEINIPPGGLDGDDDDVNDADEPGKELATSGSNGAVSVDTPPQRTAETGDVAPSTPLIVDDLVSERAVLRILRRKAGKRPRVIEIHHLSMDDTGSNEPWRFSATLTIPTPPGRIETRGTFGPWNAAEPSRTALAAKYEFHDAVLGTFDGIRGKLDSTGAFSGVLDRIEVDGETSVPDFALADVGHAVPLTTRFHAIVDGTSGNTWLRPVDARFLHTRLRATGAVVEQDGQDGHTIKLDVVMREGRIEDVLWLAAKSRKPPLSGTLTLVTTLLLPPGKADEEQRLQLNGSFGITQARFNTGNVQTKVNQLSQKARGIRDAAPDQVVSTLNGRFVMRGGVIRFSKVSFAVPGAQVNLSGRYGVDLETVDFRGTAHLDAKLSQMTGGVAAFFLKLVDPIVRHRDVTVLPLTVRGTAEHPEFRVDVRRALLPK